MQNEITAEMLAQRIAADAGRPEYNISLHLFCERFLLATRALAALQCDKKHARMVADAATYRALAALQAEQPKPKRVRAWYCKFMDGNDAITINPDTAELWSDITAHTVTRGWFTADEGQGND